jgi:chromosome segregation ATPase
MGYDIGPKIGIEGEAEYRKALQQINTTIKTLGTEMSAVTSAFDKNDRSVESLAAQNEVLNRQIDAQKQKLSELKRFLEAAKDKYGDNNEATQRWQQLVNKTTAELNQHERALSENSKALDDLKRGYDEVGDELKEFKDDAEDAAEKGGLLGTVFKAGFFANIASDALRSVIGKVKELATEALNLADELTKMSEVTGFSAEELQKMKYIGDDLGVSLETQTGALKRIINNMSSAKKGTGDAYNAFKRLNISVTDANGELKDSKKVYFEVLDALKKVTNETERDAMAQDILGKSATELNPLIKAGSAALEELGEKAQESGAVMSDEAVAALDSFGDGIDHVKQKLTAFVGETLANLISTFGVNTVDSLTQAAQAIDDVGKKYTETVDDIQATAAVGDLYVGTLERLEQQGLNTAAAHKEYKDTVEKLNAIMPDLNLKINEQTGLIEGGTKALREHIEALKKEALTQALKEKYTETIKAQADAVWELAENQNKLEQANLEIIKTNAMLDKKYMELAGALGITYEEAAKLGLDLNEMSTYAQMAGGKTGNLAQEILELHANIGKASNEVITYSAAVNEGNTAVEGANKAIEDAASVYESVTGKLITATETTNNFVNATDAAFIEILNSADKYNAMYSKGQSFVQGFIDGLNSKQTEAEKKAYAMAHGTELAVASALGIHSPSTVMREHGKQSIVGFAQGIEDNMNLVRKAMGQLNSEMKVNPDFGGFSQSTGTGAGVKVDVHVPVSLDGRNITTATGRVQHKNNKTRSRSLGVVP